MASRGHQGLVGYSVASRGHQGLVGYSVASRGHQGLVGYSVASRGHQGLVGYSVASRGHQGTGPFLGDLLTSVTDVTILDVLKRRSSNITVSNGVPEYRTHSNYQSIVKNA